MATFQRFEEIEAWQKARKLAQEIYTITEQGRFSKDFDLRNQIRRSSCSIMSNIAEGFERSGTKEFIQFLSIAKGSVGEVRSQLYIALDQNYITHDTFNHLCLMSEEISRMIGALINYLRKTKIKGHKFK